MENSARPEISQFASRMATMCDGPPSYYNLDVIETWEAESGGPSMKTVVVGAATAAAGVAAVAAATSKSGDQSDEQQTSGVDYTEPAPVVSDTAIVEEPTPAVITTTESVDYPDAPDRPI